MYGGKEFLLRTQNVDGSWGIKESKHNEPSVFLTDLALTSQSLNALNYVIDEKCIESIKKGIKFCYDQELRANDPIDMPALKLQALKLSNVKYVQESAKKIVKQLSNKQEEGCWKVFPSTFNSTNYILLSSLYDLADSKVFDKSEEWFRKNIAKDGKGWGKSGKDNEAVKRNY